ncbi:MAG: YceI family protein [Acidimicrobiales bacterium]
MAERNEPTSMLVLIAQRDAGELNGVWTLVPELCLAKFRTKSLWGLIGIEGRASFLRGTITVDQAHIEGDVEIDARNISSKNKRRDGHLQSSEFFATNLHPTIEIRIDRIDAQGGAFAAQAQIIIKGMPVTVTLPLEVTRIDEHTTRVRTITVVDRSWWGLRWNQFGMASMQNHLEVTTTFVRRPPDATEERLGVGEA